MKPACVLNPLINRGLPRLVATLVVTAGTLLALPTARLQAAPPAATPLRYNTHRIAVPAGFSAVGPRAINDAGVVTGELAPPQAFRAAFDGATGTRKTTALGTLLPGNAGASYGTGINDEGHIVGNSDADAPFWPWRAFIWDSVNGLRSLESVLSDADRYDPATGNGWVLYEAYAINDHGQVIGYGELCSGGVPVFSADFLLEGVGSEAVSIRGIDPPDGTLFPRGLNNPVDPLDVRVAGQLYVSSSNPTHRAAVWQSGVVTPIAGTHDGIAINTGGSVVGRYNGGSASRGFLWSPGGAPLILNSFRATDPSEPLDLNDARQVVGFGRTSSLTARAALWESGSATPIDLRTISTTDKKWVFHSGRGISNTMHNGTARYITGAGTYGSAEAAFVLQAR